MSKFANPVVIIVSYFIALDYLGSLLLDDLAIKLLAFIPAVLFYLFIVNNSYPRKFGATFIFILFCFLLPISHIYISMCLLAFLLILDLLDKLNVFKNIYAQQLAIMYTILTISYWHIPVVFNTVEALSKSLSKAVTLGTGFGSTSSIFIAVLAVLGTIFLNFSQIGIKRCLRISLITIAVYISILNVNVFMFERNPLIGELVLPFEVVLICMLISQNFSGFEDRAAISHPFIWIKLFAPCVTFIITILFALISQSGVYQTSNIAILKSNEPMVNLVQQPGRTDNIGFGMSSFTFSGFRMYLQALGNTVSIADTLSEIDFSNVDTVLLIHHNSRNSSEDIKRITDFVKKGGRIIAFGDHNNIFNSTKQTNELLKFSGLKIRDDISDNILKDSGLIWRNSLSEFLGSPFVTDFGLVDETSIGVWGGASVNTADPFATPLLIANFGISDPSLKIAKSDGDYTGNRRFDRGDEFSNTPLGYAKKYGNGEIILFGDTSYLQTPQLMYNWRFIYQIFNKESAFFIPNFLQIILIIGNILFAIIICKTINVKKYRMSLILCLLVTTTLGIVIGNTLLSSPYNQPLNMLTGEYTVIDNSLENYYSTSMLEKDSVTGIGYISMTHNRPAFVIASKNETTAVHRASTYIIINPTEVIDEVLVTDSLNRGTDVLIIAGKEYYKNIRNLLEGNKIFLTNTFLGPIPWKNSMIENTSVDDAPEFVEAWEVSYDENTTFPLYEIDGYVPAVYTKIGNGTLYYIADSRFIDKENIEGEFSGKIGNIKLLERILFKN